MSKPVVGAQLYTVREHLKTLPDIEKTFHRVREIGYTQAQISGIGPVDYREVARLIREADLGIACTHMSWSRFLEELDEVIEIHKAWGCRHCAIGSLPSEYRSLEGIERFARELSPIAARLADEGMDFSYHNHNQEFVRYEGRTWLSRLMDRTASELNFELDVYWVQAGGADPAQWVRDCAGREPLLHLKDMAIAPDRTQLFAPVGEGNLNWPAILKAAEEGGVEHLLVEQDNCYDEDPFECLATSYRNLAAMGYR